MLMNSKTVVNMSTAAAQQNNNEEPGLHGTYRRQFLCAPRLQKNIENILMGVCFLTTFV